MADDEDFDEKDFYDHAKKAEVYFGKDVSRRHHKAALRDFLHWMDRSGAAKQEEASPGAKAAALAAVPDENNKELANRLKITDDKGGNRIADESTPVEDQPKGFNEAADKAHDVYMSALGKSEK